MALIKKTELRTLNTKQIDDRIKELRKDLLKFNAQRAVGTTIENPGKIKLIKRTIAKLLTIKNQNSHNDVKIEKKDLKEGNKK